MNDDVTEGRVRLASEVKKLMNAMGELVEVTGEGEVGLTSNAHEEFAQGLLDLAYVACAAADYWAAAKGELPGDEPAEWLHLYRMARIAPFAIRGLIYDPSVWILSDLYDLLRDALEATDRIAVEGLVEDT